MTDSKIVSSEGYSYSFSVIIPNGELSHDTILDATDALRQMGCTDASLQGHPLGFAVTFDRTAGSLQAAIAAAIFDVEGAGFRVLRVEIEREMIKSWNG